MGNLQTDSASSDNHWYCYETTLPNADGKGNPGKITNCIVEYNCHYCSGPCYEKWSSTEKWTNGPLTNKKRDERKCDQSFYS